MPESSLRRTLSIPEKRNPYSPLPPTPGQEVTCSGAAQSDHHGNCNTTLLGASESEVNCESNGLDQTICTDQITKGTDHSLTDKPTASSGTGRNISVSVEQKAETNSFDGIDPFIDTDPFNETDPFSGKDPFSEISAKENKRCSGTECDKKDFASFVENQENFGSSVQLRLHNGMDQSDSTYGTAWGNTNGATGDNTRFLNESQPPLPARNSSDTYGTAWETRSGMMREHKDLPDTNRENQPPLPPKNTARPRPMSLPVRQASSQSGAVPKTVTRQNSRQLTIVHGSAATEDSPVNDNNLVVISPGMKEPKDAQSSDEEDFVPVLPPRRSVHGRVPSTRTTPPPFSPFTPPSISSPLQPVDDPWNPQPPVSNTNSAATPSAESPFGAASLYPSPPITPASPTSPTTPLRPDQPFSSSIVPPKMLEALGISDDDMVGGWHAPPPDTDAPPPYSPKNQLQKGANKSLKLSQVEVLRREMAHTGGVRVLLRKIDCHHNIAMVDIAGKVW